MLLFATRMVHVIRWDLSLAAFDGLTDYLTLSHRINHKQIASETTLQRGYRFTLVAGRLKAIVDI